MMFIKQLVEKRNTCELARHLTGSPERSEYFLAGLKDGGASMLASKIKNIPYQFTKRLFTYNSKELCTCHGIGVALRGFFHIHDLLERLPRTTASTSNGAFARVLKITRKFKQYTEVIN